MEGTSARHVICLLHIGGRFLSGEEGDLRYVGGRTISRTIKEGTTYEELRAVVATVIGEETRGISMKFRVCFDDTTTYVDLVDDEGVEHFINFNEAIGDRGVFEATSDCKATRTTKEEEERVSISKQICLPLWKVP